MSRTTDQRRLPWAVGFLGLLLAMMALVGCFNLNRYVPAQPGGRFVEHAPRPRGPILPGPRINHEIHAGDLECSDCHALNEETGRFEQPSLEFCQDCHEDIDEDKPPEEQIQNIFFTEDGEPKWKTAAKPYDDEVIFGHTQHAALDCKECHGNPEAPAEGRRHEYLYSMAECSQCHTQRQAPNECATCHQELRTTSVPPSHDTRWKRAHGRAFYQRNPVAVTADQCEMCHTSQSYCDRCHQVEQPLSHKKLWKTRHGQIVRAARGSESARCDYCHTQPAFCESCHLAEQPRDHTHIFRIRTHGVMASLDRERCQTCHTTDFCVRCHEDTAPLSHRGMFARVRNTHCVNCHFPIQRTQNCSTCHFENPTHSTALPLPATHTPGSNCRNCHNSVGFGGAPPLRHVDNGMNCEFCHK